MSSNPTLRFVSQVVSVTALVFVVILWTRAYEIGNPPSTDDTSTPKRIVNDDGTVYMTTEPQENNSTTGVEMAVGGEKVMGFSNTDGLQLELGKRLALNNRLEFQDTPNHTNNVTYSWPSSNPTATGNVLTGTTSASTTTTTWDASSNFQHITYRGTPLSAPRILRVSKADTPNVDIGITPITIAPTDWSNIEVKTGELVRLSFTIVWDNDQAQSSSVPFCLINILRDGSSVSTWKQGVAGTTVTGGEYATHNPTYFDVVDPGVYSYSFQLSTTVDNVMIIVTTSGCYGELAVVYMPEVTVNNDNWN